MSPSPVMVIDGPVKLTIALVEIDRVHHHEEVIPQLLEALRREIERDGYLKHPVILDEASLVVLDGTHRIKALEALGCRRVLACLVDYAHPGITVGCWYRTLKGTPPLHELAAELKRKLGLKVKLRRDLRPDEIGAPPVALAIADGRAYAEVRADFTDRWEAWALVKDVERLLTEMGVEMGFEVEEDAMDKLAGGEVDAVLMTPRITKGDVVRAASSGRVFPYKATRHVIPARPLFLNVPLELLRSERPIEELEEELRSALSSKKLREYPPGSVIEGRRYKEQVYVLE